MVASGRMAFSASESASGPSSSVVSMGLAALPASSPPLLQVSRGTSPSCVDTLQRVFRKRGFLLRADGFMALPGRQSSARVFQAKFIFFGWCESRDCHSLLASVMDFADFFLFLWNTKHLFLPSIRGIIHLWPPFSGRLAWMSCKIWIFQHCFRDLPSRLLPARHTFLRGFVFSFTFFNEISL